MVAKKPTAGKARPVGRGVRPARKQRRGGQCRGDDMVEVLCSKNAVDELSDRPKKAERRPNA